MSSVRGGAVAPAAPRGCSRSRRPRGWRAAPGRCWSARCGARAPRPGAPASCPAAASGPPGRRRSRRTPRSAAPACAGTAACADRQARLAAGQRAADPPGDAGRDPPQDQDGRRRRQRVRNRTTPGRRPSPCASTGALPIAQERGDERAAPAGDVPGSSGRTGSTPAAAGARRASATRCARSHRGCTHRLVGQAGERQRRVGRLPAGHAPRPSRDAAAAVTSPGLRSSSQEDRAQPAAAAGSRPPRASTARPAPAHGPAQQQQRHERAGTRLRRRLSRIFQRDSADSGFVQPRARRARARAAAATPRSASRRGSSGGGGATSAA